MDMRLHKIVGKFDLMSACTYALCHPQGSSQTRQAPRLQVVKARSSGEICPIAAVHQIWSAVCLGASDPIT